MSAKVINMADWCMRRYERQHGKVEVVPDDQVAEFCNAWLNKFNETLDAELRRELDLLDEQEKQR